MWNFVKNEDIHLRREVEFLENLIACQLCIGLFIYNTLLDEKKRICNEATSFENL